LVLVSLVQQGLVVLDAKGECWLNVICRMHVHVHSAMCKKQTALRPSQLQDGGPLGFTPTMYSNFAAFSLESLKFEGM
jgi:hypothetical protein